MAKQITCDRCGRTYDVPESESIMLVVNEGGNMRTKDLCDKCRESLDAWWNRIGARS